MNMETDLYRSSGQDTPSEFTGKLLSLGALLLCSAVLTVCRYRQLSTGQGSTLNTVLTGGACALFFTLAILSRSRFAPVLRHGLLSVTFGASAAAFLLLASTALSIYYARFAPIADRVTDDNAVVSLLTKLFAILSAAYFLLASSWPSLPKRKSLHLLLSIAPILFCALRILNNFINNSTLPLAASGGYRILGMIAAMLFFLQEGKLLVGTKTASAYLVTGYAAVLLCAAYDLPLLIFSMREGGSAPDAAYSLLSLGLVVYILARLAALPARKAEN